VSLRHAYFNSALAPALDICHHEQNAATAQLDLAA